MEVKGIVTIGLEHIHPHPDNPRKDLGDLTELAESIKKNGIMQNLRRTGRIHHNHRSQTKCGG